jgi:hypothetical protein
MRNFKVLPGSGAGANGADLGAAEIPMSKVSVYPGGMNLSTLTPDVNDEAQLSWHGPVSSPGYVYPAGRA